MARPTVLVLDGELGFVFALSVELSKRHIPVFPARTAREARNTISRFQLDPDLLVINCSSPGACALAAETAKHRPDVQVIAMVSEHYQCRNCARLVAAQFRYPEDQEPERIPHCADVIEALLKERHPSRHAGGGESS
jgi:DNA-binding NtrC family response regulator